MVASFNNKSVFMKTITGIHIYALLIGAIFSTFSYILLRINHLEIDNIDKFWCALPIFSGMISTNQCIFGRIVRYLIRRR